MTYDDVEHRITQAQDNAGRSYLYEYDEGGRLIKVTNPLGATASFTYL